MLNIHPWMVEEGMVEEGMVEEGTVYLVVEDTDIMAEVMGETRWEERAENSFWASRSIRR